MTKVLLALVIPCLVSYIIVQAQYPTGGYGGVPGYGAYGGYGAYSGYGSGYGSHYGGNQNAGLRLNYRLAQRSFGAQQRALDLQGILKSVAAGVFALAYYSLNTNSTGALANTG